MPLKPIYTKSPLTDLTSIPLRAGQVQVSTKEIEVLSEKLNDSEQLPACWEAGIRLGALLGKQNVPAEQWTRAKLAEQAEDGGIGLHVAESIAVMRAAYALYEQYTERDLLEKLLKFCLWLHNNWEDVIADAKTRTLPADLMELLTNLYRITGKKGILVLCENLRRDSMSWSSILHTFSVQRPMKRVTSWQDMEAGMADEQGDEAGFYTRQAIICKSENLADGARAATVTGIYSGNRTELESAKIGWERISRAHGAACGGLTADDFVAGANPSAGVSIDSVGAWAQAFALQGNVQENAWAFDCLEVLLHNAMPATVVDDYLVGYQRVNSLKKSCATSDCYHAQNDENLEVRSLARIANGYAAALHAAVSMKKDGLQVNLYQPGDYRLPLDGKSCRLHVEGENGKYTLQLQMKQPCNGKIALRIPSWTNDAYIRVNDEGGFEGKAGTYLELERQWNNNDTITVEFGMELICRAGYHQGLTVFYGPTLMALPVTETNWRFVATGQPTLEDGQVVLTVKATEAWKQQGDVPDDLPVRPVATGDEKKVVLVPYAQAPQRIAVFPQEGQA